MSTGSLPTRWLEKAAIEFLTSNPDIKFRARDIAEWIFDNYRSYCEQRESLQRFNGDRSLTVKKLRSDIFRHTDYIKKHEPKIIVITGKPRYYYYESDDESSIKEKEEPFDLQEVKVDEKYNEESLYTPLCEFLYSELDVYCKRINEGKSSNKRGIGGNKWLHPDIVGVGVPKWIDDVKSCALAFTDSKPELWSFEVKKEITVSTIRDYSLQAIANSSWENFGYLVVAEINNNHRSHIMRELRMLSRSHGIGCILLNKDEPTESHIIIPARKRADIDWHFVDRIASENDDFLKYVKAIESISNGERFHPEEWNYEKDWDE